MGSIMYTIFQAEPEPDPVNDSQSSTKDSSLYDSGAWPDPPHVGDVNREAQRLASEAIERAATLHLQQRSVHRLGSVFSMSYHPWVLEDIDGLAQDCSNSSALAVELLQSCTKPSISLLNVLAPSSTISLALVKTAVTPVRLQWCCCNFVLSYQYDIDMISIWYCHSSNKSRIYRVVLDLSKKSPQLNGRATALSSLDDQQIRKFKWELSVHVATASSLQMWHLMMSWQLQEWWA